MHETRARNQRIESNEPFNIVRISLLSHKENKKKKEEYKNNKLLLVCYFSSLSGHPTTKIIRHSHSFDLPTVPQKKSSNTFTELRKTHKRAECKKIDKHSRAGDSLKL
jgi:hypothetical protein